MNALVTGGTGFVGSHVVRALNAAGHGVRVVHRTSSKLDALQGLKYESVIADLLNVDEMAAAMAGCDWVFHVAAVADYWRQDSVDWMFRVNVDGTKSVLDAARRVGVKRVIFTSSGAAVGYTSGKPSDESVAFNLPPERFPYAHSKVLAEAEVQRAVDAGLDAVTVNPAVILGPGDLNQISGSIVLEVKRRGWTMPVPPGGVSVIDVRDVARMHLAAAERGRAGERYLLSNENIRYRDLFGMAAAVTGASKPALGVPGWALEVLGMSLDGVRRLGIKTPMDGNQARLGKRFVYFDARKAWDELGAPAVSVRQSLEDTYAWYRENGFV